MSNRFHPVVETPQPNLVAGMKWLPGKSPFPGLCQDPESTICDLASSAAFIAPG
jgi:hypothetical protein